MTEPKATQCPVCKKGKREQDKYCSEKCAWRGEVGTPDFCPRIDTCDVCGEELDPIFGRCRNAVHQQERKKV